VVGASELRYFSSYPLIEDNSVRASSSALANARVAYQFNKTWSTRLDILNLFNSETNDITYFYASRLQGEPPGGIDDIHFHPAEPRQFRLTVVARF
jgi:outer membrane receptor protein involved in Fe transport